MALMFVPYHIHWLQRNSQNLSFSNNQMFQFSAFSVGVKYNYNTFILRNGNTNANTGQIHFVQFESYM